MSDAAELVDACFVELPLPEARTAENLEIGAGDGQRGALSCEVRWRQVSLLDDLRFNGIVSQYMRGCVRHASMIGRCRFRFRVVHSSGSGDLDRVGAIRRAPISVAIEHPWPFGSGAGITTTP